VYDDSIRAVKMYVCQDCQDHVAVYKQCLIRINCHVLIDGDGVMIMDLRFFLSNSHFDSCTSKSKTNSLVSSVPFLEPTAQTSLVALARILQTTPPLPPLSRATRSRRNSPNKKYIKMLRNCFFGCNVTRLRPFLENIFLEKFSRY
jgi:hypothetical protein